MFSFFQFISGLSFFFLGLNSLESSLNKISSKKLQIILEKFTNHPLKSILVGIISTAVLQSSSLVTLLLLAFVGAKIIKFRNAIGVILGANLGTTFTGWIIATIGFKFDINLISYYLLSFGLISFLINQEKIKNISKISLSIGLLFFGLSYMKLGMSQISSLIDLSLIENYNIFIFFIIGFFLTAIIQSSSAMMGITLTALNEGIVSLKQAASIIIGADLGTTSTTIIGSIGKDSLKKKVALAHFIFNLVTDLLAISFLPILLNFIHYLNVKDNLYGLVLLHSTFNILGIIIFYPFLKTFERIINKFYPENNAKINPEVFTTIDTLILYLQKEKPLIINNIFNYFNLVLSKKGNNNIYYDLKNTLNIIIKSLDNIQKFELDDKEILILNKYIKEISMLGYAIKSIKDISEDLKNTEISENYKKEIYNLLNLSKNYINESNLEIRDEKKTDLFVQLKEFKRDNSYKMDHSISHYNIHMELCNCIKQLHDSQE